MTVDVTETAVVKLHTMNLKLIVLMSKMRMAFNILNHRNRLIIGQSLKRLKVSQRISLPEPEPETESVEFSIMTSENEDGLALKKRKMDETEMENEYDSDSSKDSEHHQQLLSERAEEAEMKFDDAKLRIVNLMTQKTLSIRELASIMSFASQAFDNIYKDIEQGKYKEVAGGEL